MFTDVFDKMSSFANHHQALFASIVAVCLICFSWGVEKLLESYLFPKKPIYGYITAITASLVVLWFTQHFILHVI